MGIFDLGPSADGLDFLIFWIQNIKFSNNQVQEYQRYPISRYLNFQGPAIKSFLSAINSKEGTVRIQLLKS